MLSTLLNLSVAALSAYGLYFSYNSITRLQRYEERTERAAKYSNTAAQQLHKTRTTQSSACVSFLLSALSSLYLLSSRRRFLTVVVVSLGNAGASLFARQHVQGFWAGKAKVPFVEGYNEAISGTEVMIQQLGALAVAWGAKAAVVVVGW